ncbi:MAG TPA: ATP-dependent Clp protease proteolytic subunit [Methylomirabilota bacterium]|nr:ATP-dependent Clp protease proteolytic subunit [Methylomirabilota bacterium]
MKNFCLTGWALIIAFLLIYDAHASEFLITKSSVQINGVIVKGDYERFILATKDLGPKDTIWFNSEGGHVLTGIQIAQLIKKKGWNTSVASNDLCTSTCALIWLAGKPRFAMPKSHIGFHGVYFSEDKKPSTGGNAIVGAYLAELGFNYNTIYFLTQSPPDEMEWLDIEKAKKFDIDVITIYNK